MEVSRRDFLKLTGAWAATVALGGGLGSLLSSCRGGAATTTTALPTTVPTTTATVSTTTTVPPTTTAALPTTTAVSVQSAALIGESLVLKDVRPADIPVHIYPGTVLTTIDPSAKAANALYKTKQPRYDVLYAAPANRLKDDGRGDLNAVLVNQPYRGDFMSKTAPSLTDDFFGGYPKPFPGWDWTDRVVAAIGVVRGAYVVEGDIVVVSANPLTGDLMQARLLGTLEWPYSDIRVRDLKTDVVHVPRMMEQVPDANQYVANFLKRHTLAEIVQPGDVVRLDFTSEVSGAVTKGDIQVAATLQVERLDGVGRLTDLFRS